MFLWPFLVVPSFPPCLLLYYSLLWKWEGKSSNCTFFIGVIISGSFLTKFISSSKTLFKSLFKNPRIRAHFEFPRPKAEAQDQKLRKVSSRGFNFHFVFYSEDVFDENLVKNELARQLSPCWSHQQIRYVFLQQLWGLIKSDVTSQTTGEEQHLPASSLHL